MQGSIRKQGVLASCGGFAFVKMYNKKWAKLLNSSPPILQMFHTAEDKQPYDNYLLLNYDPKERPSEREGTFDLINVTTGRSRGDNIALAADSAAEMVAWMRAIWDAKGQQHRPIETRTATDIREGTRSKTTLGAVSTPAGQGDSDWQTFTSPDGRPYYFNRKTNVTTWNKPIELTDWTETSTPDGKKFWMNKKTNISTWEKPDDLKSPAEKQAEAERRKNKAPPPSLPPASSTRQASGFIPSLPTKLPFSSSSSSSSSALPPPMPPKSTSSPAPALPPSKFTSSSQPPPLPDAPGRGPPPLPPTTGTGDRLRGAMAGLRLRTSDSSGAPPLPPTLPDPPPSSTTEATPSGGPLVVINNVTLNPTLVQLLQSQGAPVHEGRYWYDKTCGMWGFEGSGSLGFIIANLPLPGELSPDASKGTTGVFINGRQLNNQDKLQLWALGCKVQPGNYWCNAEGEFGRVGAPAECNLKRLMEEKGKQAAEFVQQNKEALQKGASLVGRLLK